MDTFSYDVIVIGAGPVGENVADRVVRGGLTAAVVERELVGGECSYWACMPTKALLRSGSSLRAARSLPGAREAVTGGLDVAAVLRRRDSFASHWADDGQVSWLDSAGIALHRGQGRIAAERTVEVTGEDGATVRLTARHAVVVATGSSALLPDIAGLREAAPWTSREAAAARTVPGRLAIIGGGVVATEMATAYASLGSAVTLLAREALLPSAESFAGAHVTEALRAAGASVHVGAEVAAVTRDADGTVRLTLTGGDRVEADELLVAVGRTPNTHDLGLDRAGLKPGAWLTVDDTLRVIGEDGTPAGGRLYAAGDVNHRALLTHQGKYQARAAGDAIVARAQGEPVEARMVVDEDRRVIVGFTVVGPDVAELLHAATVAITGEVPLDRLWHAVPAYPTVSEVWLRLLEAYGR
ncbi:hypothetical protein Asp14428_16300 [Actinoplanes sp. NBRC 14428]|nr:hypothetical protein Asp14428_16300 [Actinoplanes sp. NBRC 14428]